MNNLFFQQSKPQQFVRLLMSGSLSLKLLDENKQCLCKVSFSAEDIFSFLSIDNPIQEPTIDTMIWVTAARRNRKSKIGELSFFDLISLSEEGYIVETEKSQGISIFLTEENEDEGRPMKRYCLFHYDDFLKCESAAIQKGIPSIESFKNEIIEKYRTVNLPMVVSSSYYSKYLSGYLCYV